MKKILKKLISVPNRFEAFLQKRNLPTLIFILAFCLFTLFNLWWYGVFDDLADVTYRNRAIDEENIERYVQERVVDLPYGERSEVRTNYYEKCYQQIAPKMSTEDLLEWVLNGINADGAFSASQLYESFETGEYARIVLDELQGRRNTGKVLAKIYLEYPVLSKTASGEIVANLSELWQFEVLLAQPEFQHKLPFWTSVEKLVDQKQKEKFEAFDTDLGKEYLALSDPNGTTPEERTRNFYQRAIRNYAYPDGWEGSFWNEEKLNEYASKYIDLEEWGFTE